MSISKGLLLSCNRFFNIGNMQDCQEFLIRFLSSLLEELNPKRNYKIPENSTLEKTGEIFTKYNNSFIDGVFTGLMSSKIHCDSCKNDSITYDPFMELSVPINPKTQNLYGCLSEYFKKENIEYSTYICKNCKSTSKVSQKFNFLIR